MRLGAVAAWIALACGCGLESAGTLHRDDAGADGASCTATGPCTAGLPPGFTAVLVADGVALDCPGGVVPKGYVTNVTAGAGACDCGCTVTKPTCDQGSIHRDFGLGIDSSCLGSGFTVTLSGCTDRGTTVILGDYGKIAPVAPVGASCAAAAVAAPEKLVKDSVRTCSPNGCGENVCRGDVPPGFRACVVAAGQVACPPSFPESRAVSDDAALSCSACTCQTTDVRCDDPKIEWYDDAACTKLAGTTAVTGTCTKEPDNLLTPSHLRYVAKPSAACTATGAKTPTVAAVGEATICCKLP